MHVVEEETWSLGWWGEESPHWRRAPWSSTLRVGLTSPSLTCTSTLQLCVTVLLLLHTSLGDGCLTSPSCHPAVLEVRWSHWGDIRERIPSWGCEAWPGALPFPDPTGLRVLWTTAPFILQSQQWPGRSFSGGRNMSHLCLHKPPWDNLPAQDGKLNHLIDWIVSARSLGH